jgi:4-hydroxy-tetrahydrodipicolinate synthase
MDSIKGIICALVTPLTEDEKVDVESAKRLTRHVISGGISGIIALGSTGEQVSLTQKEKRIFMDTVREQIPESIPMIVGAGSTSTVNAIVNGIEAKKSGADAIIVTPPCFYTHSDDELIKYYREIADVVDLPLYLYNISRYAKNKISIPVVEELAKDTRFSGIKESDWDFEYLKELLKIQERYPHFDIIQGSDRLLIDSFLAGCSSGVAVTANMIPKLPVELYKNFLEGNIEKARVLQDEILEYVGLIGKFGKFPCELKAILSWEGLSTRIMTSPHIMLDSEQEDILKEEKRKLDEKFTLPRDKNV